MAFSVYAGFSGYGAVR
nr:hypothetical protein [Vibrio vulnificus]